MEKRSKIGIGLIGLGLVLMGLTLAFPVEPVLIHDTSEPWEFNKSKSEELGYRVVSYENLSDRGQELYVRTLEADGRYKTSVDEGAKDWEYPTKGEQRAPGVIAENDQTTNVAVIIERPENDSHLPPASGGDDSGESANDTDYRRYDKMETVQRTPPIGSGAHIPRLLGLLLSVASLTGGGYLIATKP
jgi:hypothetical protein